ncbi:MAG: hypothetical protein PHE55_08910 [Methylococcaceae bacterium]|nr:hypothetical protein [Methylococcaceae bacterium]
MAYLREFTAADGMFKLLIVERQILFRQFLKSFEFFRIDIGPLVFAEAKQKEPAIRHLGSNNRSCAAALALARQGDSFLDNVAAEIGVDETLRHFLYGLAQSPIRQSRLTHPASKGSSQEYSSHG